MKKLMTTNMPDPSEPPPAKAPAKPPGDNDEAGGPAKDKPPAKPE